MLQSVLDSTAEALVAADEKGKFLIWNRAAERILGNGPADLPPGSGPNIMATTCQTESLPFPPSSSPWYAPCAER